MRDLTLELCRTSPPLLINLPNQARVSSLKNSVVQKQSMKERRSEERGRRRNEKKMKDVYASIRILILNASDSTIHWKEDLLGWTELLHTAKSTICCLQIHSISEE